MKFSSTQTTVMFQQTLSKDFINYTDFIHVAAL